MSEKNQSLRVSNKSTKLIPRDISESLGKLPPQDIEIEKFILGSVMIERGAYERIKDILEPEHFYAEQHQIIFQAIVNLHAHNSPISMPSVNRQLQKVGKDELVGGAGYIAELTANIASAADIEYNARIVIELYVKRALIQIASNVHQNAYEDSTDALDMLEESVKKIQELEAGTLKSSGPHRIKSLWEIKHLTSLPDEPPPVLWIDGIPMAWPGGHSLLVGKKKSRKTLFVVWLISQYLKNKNDGNDVLVFDTEQSARHVYRTREKVLKMSGKTINVFYLRGMSPEERRNFIHDTIAYWPTPPQLIIIDGIRDLMKDINSTDESTDLVVWLEKLTLQKREEQKYPAHIVNILHLNKGNDDARGHIGTELLNKADCTIQLELDEAQNCTNVKCESSRERPFNTFSFTHNEQELPTVITNTGHEVVDEDDTQNRLRLVFDGELLNYSTLIDQTKAHFELGTNRAKAFIARFQRAGWIVKTGSAHSKDTKYKLMISENGHHAAAREMPPPDLFSESSAPDHSDDINDLPF